MDKRLSSPSIIHFLFSVFYCISPLFTIYRECCIIRKKLAEEKAGLKRDTNDTYYVYAYVRSQKNRG